MIIVTLIDLIKKYILDKKMVNADELIIYFLYYFFVEFWVICLIYVLQNQFF